MDTTAQNWTRLLEAVSFTSRAHHGQLRKDGRTPYVAHVFRVALILRHVFGIDNPTVLTAALLHDTVEDTTPDHDDILEHFGPEVAEWVGCLSKDKRLRDDEREEEYRAALTAAPWQVKVCKLADLFDNLVDSRTLPLEKRRRTVERSRHYLAAVRDQALPPEGQMACGLVERMIEEIANELAQSAGAPE